MPPRSGSGHHILFWIGAAISGADGSLRWRAGISLRRRNGYQCCRLPAQTPPTLELAEKLLQKKDVAFIGKRLHLICVADDESVSILSKKVTFFDIQSTKAKQFGFCMELGNGEKLTCCGDEPYNPCEKQYAENSTWLLHEAFCLESEADIFHPYEKHHSTVAEASKLAEELHVKNLLLYHTEDKNLLLRKELYQNEGRKYFNGTIFVPEDLETLVL